MGWETLMAERRAGEWQGTRLGPGSIELYCCSQR